MALNFGELVDELQAELGGDTSVVTDTRAKRWINAAIRHIAWEYPALRDIHVLDKTTLACQSGVYEYDLNVFRDKPVGRIISVRYIDTTEGNFWRLEMHVGGLESWDRLYPYLPDYDTGPPKEYVQRANTLEVCPVPGDDELHGRFWLEYGQAPRDMSDDTDTPVLRDFDEEIIQTAKWLALHFKSVNDASLAVLAANQRRLVDELLERRWEAEKPIDTIDQMVDYGP